MIAWKRSATRGCHIGSHGGRQVARVVRLSASAWRWSYRAPSQAVATIGEAQLLKHAKQAVEVLHQTKCPKQAEKNGNEHDSISKTSGGTGERRRGTERSRQETNAGHGSGESVVETSPSGGDDHERQGPPLWGVPLEVESTPKTVCDFREGGTPSIAAQKHGDERVEGPHPAAPRGMVSGESPERPESAHETPLGAALFEALFGNEASDA